MKFGLACAKAMDYFKKEYGDVGFVSIKDIGGKWLFNGANAERSVVYGRPGVTVDKDTGELDFFFLPDENNFALLDKATDIEIPEEYRVG